MMSDSGKMPVRQPSIAVGHPDVLDLDGPAQERLAGRAVARSSRSTRPLLVQTRLRLPTDSASAMRAGVGIGDDPQPVDIVMLGQHGGKFGASAGDDVDRAGRHVGIFDAPGRGRSPPADSAADGTATTVLPMASAGATSEIRPSSGASSRATMPMTPTGSCSASVTARAGGWCTRPSNLSAMPA